MPRVNNVAELARFRMDLTRFQQEIMPNNHARFVRAVAMRLLDDFIFGNPVDTGRSRGNWLVSKGSPNTSFNWTQYDSVGDSTFARGVSEIRSANPMQEIIYLQNNIYYIIHIEDGHSMQAPTGWILNSLNRLRIEANVI